MASPELVDYYRRRAREYEAIYAKPERQTDLAFLKKHIAERLAQRRVLEVACGTGYWTVLVTRLAAKVVATETNEARINSAAEQRIKRTREAGR